MGCERMYRFGYNKGFEFIAPLVSGLGSGAEECNSKAPGVLCFFSPCLNCTVVYLSLGCKYGAPSRPDLVITFRGHGSLRTLTMQVLRER